MNGYELEHYLRARAVIGFARGTATAGFGTSRGMRWRGPRPTHPLEDGASIAGASAWTVINTPGHTDDSVAFWHNDSHTLLSGDAVITARGAARFAPYTVDDVAALKTAARLRSLPVEHLLPGHGIPIHARNVWATRTKVRGASGPRRRALIRVVEYSS